MKVDVRDAGAWRRVLSIEVAPDELQQDYDAALEEYRRKAVIPGFRKGKVPKTMLESQFGHSLEHEVLERAVRRSYQEAVRQQGLEPVEYPAIDKISYEKGQPLSYEAAVDVRPVVAPKDYQELELESRDTAVPDTDIDRALEDLRQRAASWEKVERDATDSDAVVVDYVRLNAKGKPVHKTEQIDALVELGASGLLPEFKANLVGRKAGDAVRFEVAYPADFGNEELRGKSATFSVQVKEVRERRVREMDDQFAADVAGLRDMGELRARIRLNLEGEARMRLQRDQEEALVNQLIDRNPMELPESMIAEYLAEVSQRLRGEGEEWTEEQQAQFLKEYRPHAERRLKRDLLVDAIAKAEGITVPEEEVDETLRGAAEGSLPPPEMERLVRNAAQRDRARVHLAERKVFAHLREKAKVKMAVWTPDS
ncbi:MAG TPA: trigger factor [Candidatus Eisenbacteria bacterium]|nr:trigger factor [Candidatus Eisenbacteria bacterium]